MNINPLRYILTAVAVVVLACCWPGGIGDEVQTRARQPRVSAYALLSTNSPAYRGEARGNTTDGFFGGIGAIQDDCIKRLLSDDSLLALLNEPEVRATAWYRRFDDPSLAMADLRGRALTAERVEASTLIELRARTPRGEDTLVLLDRWIAVYMEDQDEQLWHRYEDQLRLYQADLEAAEHDIFDISVDIETFDISRPRTIRDDLMRERSRTLMVLEDQRTEATDGLATAEADLNRLIERSFNNDYTPTDDEEVLIEAQRSVMGLRDQIQQAEICRDSLGGGNRRNMDIQIQVLERELEAERDKIGREIFAANIEAARHAMQEQQDRLAALDPQIMEIEMALRDLIRIQVERESLERSLLDAEERKSEAVSRLRSLPLHPGLGWRLEVIRPPTLDE